MEKTKQPKKLSAAQVTHLQGMIANIDEAERAHEIATLELSVATEKAGAAERVKNVVTNSASNFVIYCAATTGLPVSDFAPTPTPGKWTFDQLQMAFVYMAEDAAIENEGSAE